MNVSKKTVIVFSGAAAALGLSLWAASAVHPTHASVVAAASANPERVVAEAAVTVAEMKTPEKLARIEAVLDAGPRANLAALARDQSVAGNPAVGALLTELSLEKDEYQAIHRQYQELHDRHTALVVKDPKSAAVRAADEELDGLLAEMRGSSERIQKLTNEAMAAYTADKMKELGIAER